MNNIRWDDQVFANRNQAYGAYALRKNYSNSVTRSFAFAMVVVAAIIMSPMVKAMFKETVVVNDTKTESKEIVLPPPPSIEVVVPPPPQVSIKPPASIRFVVPKPTDKDVTEDPPSIDDLKKSNVSAFNSEGDDVVFVEPVPIEPVEAKGDEKNKVWVNVEIPPAYPGGIAEMMKFISKNTKYPSGPARLGIEGTSFISFVVNEDGSISMIEPVRALHPDLDKEAMRVISKMPLWKPGIQNGNKVKVKFILPIRFSLGN